jgi:hypothetical protein
MPFTPLLGSPSSYFVTNSIFWPGRPKYGFFGNFLNAFSYVLLSKGKEILSSISKELDSCSHYRGRNPSTEL